MLFILILQQTYEKRDRFMNKQDRFKLLIQFCYQLRTVYMSVSSACGESTAGNLDIRLSSELICWKAYATNRCILSDVYRQCKKMNA